jgi:hypothetical protein
MHRSESWSGTGIPSTPRLVTTLTYEQLIDTLSIKADSCWFRRYFYLDEIADLLPKMKCQQSTIKSQVRRQLVTYAGSSELTVNPMDVLLFLREAADKAVKYRFLCVDTEGDTLALRADWIEDPNKSASRDLGGWKLYPPLETSTGYVPAEERPC